MARTALNSPAHRILQKHPTGNLNTSPDAAISLDYLGNGLLDHRMQYNRFNALGNGVLAAAVGWVGSPIPAILDQTIANAPATGTGGVAAAAHATSGTAFTLTTATTLTNGALITPSALTTFPFATVIPASTVVVQSQMAYLTVGIRDITAAYDPTNACARALAVTGVTSGAPTGGVFTIAGWDVYGAPMHENILAPTGAATVAGVKAWKWISSITPNFTDAHNYSVDVLNIFGLHIAVDAAAYVQEFVAGTGYTQLPVVTAAVTNVATATTGDVRGTVTLTPGSNRITLFALPTAARTMLNPNDKTGIFGQVQF